MGEGAVCPACGAGPSRSVMGRGLGKVGSLTGTVLEKGVRVTESVVREVKPAVKEAVELGKKGARKAKDGTLKVAKELKEK